MATGTTPDNREFLFRLQTLIIDGGTEVLRNTFDQKMQNTPLHAFLASEKATINRLLRQNIITRTQYDQLYPQGGQHPNSADFDITLIICLLRNIKFFRLNRNFSWQIQPQPADLSIEADLCRLKGFRNKVAHISSTQEFDQNTFQTHWSEIENVLLRLNTALANPDPIVTQKIDDYKIRPLDIEAETRLQEEIEIWQKMEACLDTQMQLMKGDVKELVKDVKEVQKDIQKVHVMLAEKRNENDINNERVLRVDVSEVQENLITLYRRRHALISLSPLLEREDASLLKFYQKPEINSVQVGGGKEEKTPVETLSDLFLKDNVCSEIYLIGDAGLGKTSFCRRLILTWCQAKNRITDEDKYFSRDEINAMNKFDIVFLLTLRESASNSCDIDDLIYNQIFSSLDRTYSLEDLENILSNTTCLVILDGLDEWTHPSIHCTQGSSEIPHRRARQKWKILTTSRPWKLFDSNITISDNDQKLEICGLSKDSAHMLKRTMISHIFHPRCEEEEELNKQIENFQNELRKHRVSSLERNPLMLKYLLCLWCDQTGLGESLCEIYATILELLFFKTAQKYKKRRIELPLPGNGAQQDLPSCFLKHKMGCEYYQLLVYLSKVAFNSLITGSLEYTLVLGSKDEELSQELLHFSLQLGILTQNKDGGRLTIQEIKVSFAHKTMQEFFAALHMHTNPDKSTLETKIVSRCKCVEDILGMSKVFIFLSGINVNVLSSISRDLINVINDDRISLEFRTMTQNIFSPTHEKHLKKLQSMCISCLRENPDNINLKIFLQDIYIDEGCRQENTTNIYNS